MVAYEYELDGGRHTGDRWSVNGSDWYADEADARRVADRFAPGARVPVLVDPADPDAAVLVGGGAGEAWGHVGLGVLLVLVGGFVVLRGLRGS